MANNKITVNLTNISNPEIIQKRPPLFLMLDKDCEVLDGVWLGRTGERVCVKQFTVPAKVVNVPVGTVGKGYPKGPKYTGPIDDEMMANILIYG